MANVSREIARKRRHERVRKKVSGTTGRPRLNVYRSLENIYAQVIDDDDRRHAGLGFDGGQGTARPLASLNKTEQAKAVGKAVAERAKAKGIEQVVFDRGGFPYHGRVKALADGSREGGLAF
jgi:large subunit ribosomal protein L18